MKKSQIINSLRSLEEYSPDGNIRQTIKELSFAVESMQTFNWEIFIKKEDGEEFVAVYRKYEKDRNKPPKEFLVSGDFSNKEIHRKDLEAIAKFLERGKVVKFFESSRFMIESGTFATTGIFAFVLNKYLSWEISPKLLLSFAIGSDIGGLSLITAREMSNKHYGSKLSDQAEDYLYGKDAELRLGNLPQ